ncbi:MAG: hypothetical protein ACLSS0_06800 [Clostridioides difficile]
MLRRSYSYCKNQKELKDISDKDIFAINIKGLKGGYSYRDRQKELIQIYLWEEF